MTALRLALRCGLLVLVALGGTGCVIIPLPEHGSLAGRNEIGDESTDWLVPGETTKADALLAYGEPERIEHDGRVLIYAWTVTQGIIAVGYGYAGGDAGPIPKNYLLLLAFDDEAVLEQFELTEARWFQSRRQRALEWLKELESPAPP